MNNKRTAKSNKYKLENHVKQKFDINQQQEPRSLINKYLWQEKQESWN